MKFSFLSFVASVLFVFANMTFAKEQCPAINCDCSALAGESWVKACEQHETRIKEACVANANTPKDYCAVHGPKAKPLPLSMQLSEFTLDPSTKVKDLEEQLEGEMWAATSDADAAASAFKEAAYARTLKILKLINGNSDQAFQTQQKIASLLVGDESNARALRGSWKDYAKAADATADKLQVFGDAIAAQMAIAATEKEKKIFSVLSQKALRVAGKNFEHSGYAHGQADRESSAAKAWSQAAKVSSKIAEINKTIGGKSSAIKFAEFQAAARLHRASYHWLKNESLDDSVDALKDSQDYVDRDTQQAVDTLITTEEEKDTGVLGGILSGR